MMIYINLPLDFGDLFKRPSHNLIESPVKTQLQESVASLPKPSMILLLVCCGPGYAYLCPLLLLHALPLGPSPEGVERQKGWQDIGVT